MTVVVLCACFLALLALVGLWRAAAPTHVERLSEDEGNSLDRALCALIKDVASTPPRRQR